MSTDPLLWIFVPASPIATLFFAASIYLNINDEGLPVLDALSFISNFKYGLWTVFCLIYYSDIFFTGNSVGLYSFMLVSHFAMAAQAFLLFKWGKIGVKALVVAFLWYVFNDLIDYTFSTHTELYTEYTLPAELAAYSLTFTAFLLGLLLIQKDRIQKSCVKFEKFREGDKILFNDRKKPLTVDEIEDGKMAVKGPSGGEYEIYYDGDTRLVAKPGNRKYASYCKNLRKVGKWIKKGDKWVHSKTEASIKIIRKDNGFWTLKSEKFHDELENPMYGFSNKEAAIEEGEKFIGKRPEG